MSDFKTLKGLFIKHVSSDPANPIEGQIWYNTSILTIKAAPKISAWAAGENFPSAQSQLGGCGIQTAALSCTGNPYAVTTFEYDGTDWTAGGNHPTANELSGLMTGTQTAAIAKTGILPGSVSPRVGAKSAEYNGTAWSDGEDSNTNRARGAMSGTQTASFAVGGIDSLPVDDNRTNATEEYDGTNWATGNAGSTARDQMWASGTLTAGLWVGGAVPPGDVASNATEEYDGTNWTAGGDLPAAKYSGSVTGTQTASIHAGGAINPPKTIKSTSESYDGSSWSALPALGAARYNHGAAGADGSSAVVWGGSSGSNVNTTEEFTAAVTVRSVDTT